MPAEDFLLWEQHFRYFPPGDRGAHQLLAMLVMAKTDPKKRYQIKDIAPWLETPADRKRRDEQSIDDGLDIAFSVVNPKDGDD